jgi:UDP:flavonoid glycosyltransferase YjiC (YdhE family)
MKILYAVQGTGNGHVSRACDVIPELKKYAQVDILFLDIKRIYNCLLSNI